MKIKTKSPIDAAIKTGGCTMEPEIGWWTYSTENIPEIGEEIEECRDALYIPTLQKNGEPVKTALVKKLRENAKKLGFTNETPASGMWVLSETGEVQIEYIWILWNTNISEKTQKRLTSFAKKIKKSTNQDCVAYELQGHLNFI
jgi:hypothetical protein